MARICLIKGESQYDVMRYFSDLLAEEFRKGKHDAVLLDMADPGWPKAAGGIFGVQTDFVVSFNAVGIDINTYGKSLYERLGITFVAVLMDHPIHHLERLNSAPRGSLVVCVDETHAQFIQRHYRGMLSSAFLPHAGMESPGPVPNIKDREFDLVFSGTYTDPDAISADWKNLPETIRKVFEETAARLLADESAVHDLVVDESFAGLGLHSGYETRAAFIGQTRVVDLYVRAVRRRDAVRTLAAGGLSMDLFGTNWQQAGLEESKNVRLHTGTPLVTVLETMKRTKLVVNIMPAFPRGAHDRIFSAMLSGAVAVSDTTDYLSTFFQDGRDGVFFRWKDLSGLPERLRTLLADPERLQTIADQGRKVSVGQHDWPDRTARLLAMIEAHRVLVSITAPVS
jgi:hypothetical protein